MERLRTGRAWLKGLFVRCGCLVRAHSPVVVRAGAYLGTRYPDSDVAAMAWEDGQARFGTAVWGEGNRALHGLRAVLQASATHAVAMRQWLDEVSRKVAGAHARARQRFLACLAEAYTAQGAVAQAAARHAALTEKLADRGLSVPTPAWKILAFLGLLGIGDLTMTSVAMMMLNISSRPYVSWLPFTALQVAAFPVVFGLLAAAHFLGESVKAYRCEQRLRPVNLLIALASLSGGLSLALCVASIRSSYLAANGVPAMFWAFFGIQFAFFAVAVAASTFAAHPYRAEWRQTARGLRRSVSRYRRIRRRLARLAGQINDLVAQHRSVVARGADGVAAVTSDGARQGHMYLRGHQHGLPEPVTEELCGGPMLEPNLAAPVLELLGYPEVLPGSNLVPLEPVSVDDLDAAWQALLHEMRASSMAWPAREPAIPQLTAGQMNGAARIQPQLHRDAPARVNGKSRHGAE